MYILVYENQKSIQLFLTIQAFSRLNIFFFNISLSVNSVIFFLAHNNSVLGRRT